MMIGFSQSGDRISLRSMLIGLALMVPAVPAAAQEGQAIPADTDSASGTLSAMSMFGVAPLPDAELAATTGRQQENWMSATSTNSAVVRDNYVGDNVATGDVTVADSAFQNLNGIAMVNFNTGNNSSINAAMSLNVQINYAAPTP
ncbi:MAG: hypothetical protein AB7E05_01765 [Sphingobium sp.]